MSYVYNSRQMPKRVNYTSDRKYNDLIYGYLQVKSYRNEGQNYRYVPKNEMAFEKVGNDLDMTRQTVGKYIKDFQESELITKEKGKYILNVLKLEDGVLIPEDTLRQLVDRKKRHLIDTYIYLLNRYRANNYQSYNVLFDQIKSYIGINTSTSSNKKINELLKELREMGLMLYNNNRDSERKRHLKILWVKQYKR